MIGHAKFLRLLLSESEQMMSNSTSGPPSIRRPELVSVENSPPKDSIQDQMPRRRARDMAAWAGRLRWIKVLQTSDHGGSEVSDLILRGREGKGLTLKDHAQSPSIQTAELHSPHLGRVRRVVVVGIVVDSILDPRKHNGPVGRRDKVGDFAREPHNILSNRLSRIERPCPSYFARAPLTTVSSL
jgi:hypothetical protein